MYNQSVDVLLFHLRRRRVLPLAVLSVLELGSGHVDLQKKQNEQKTQHIDAEKTHKERDQSRQGVCLSQDLALGSRSQNGV